METMMDAIPTISMAAGADSDARLSRVETRLDHIGDLLAEIRSDAAVAQTRDAAMDVRLNTLEETLKEINSLAPELRRAVRIGYVLAGAVLAGVVAGKPDLVTLVLKLFTAGG